MGYSPWGCKESDTIEHASLASLACGPTHVARLEFPRETGLILRCAGKPGNTFQTTQGNQLSCREQERSRSSEEVVPGLSVFPSREPDLFEGNPVGEGTTRRGTATPGHRPQRPAGSTHSSARGLRPPEQLEWEALQTFEQFI